MIDFSNYQDRILVALSLILFGVLLRYITLRVLTYIEVKFYKTESDQSMLFRLFKKCCRVTVNIIIPFIIFTFVAIILGD